MRVSKPVLGVLIKEHWSILKIYARIHLGSAYVGVGITATRVGGCTVARSQLLSVSSSKLMEDKVIAS